MDQDDKDADAAVARGDPPSKELGGFLDDATLAKYAARCGKRPERQADGSVIFV